MIEVHPAYEEYVVRIQLFGDEVEQITTIDPVTGERLQSLSEVVVFPATHYVAGEERMRQAIEGIEVELQERLAHFEKEGKLLEAQRLRMRTTFDLEMMPGDRALQWDRELLPPHRRAGARRTGLHAAGLLPRRLHNRDRRVPCGRAPAPRPVRR